MSTGQVRLVCAFKLVQGLATTEGGTKVVESFISCFSVHTKTPSQVNYKFMIRKLSDKSEKSFKLTMTYVGLLKVLRV